MGYLAHIFNFKISEWLSFIIIVIYLFSKIHIFLQKYSHNIRSIFSSWVMTTSFYFSKTYFIYTPSKYLWIYPLATISSFSNLFNPSSFHKIKSFRIKVLAFVKFHCWFIFNPIIWLIFSTKFCYFYFMQTIVLIMRFYSKFSGKLEG